MSLSLPPLLPPPNGRLTAHQDEAVDASVRHVAVLDPRALRRAPPPPPSPPNGGPAQRPARTAEAGRRDGAVCAPSCRCTTRRLCRRAAPARRRRRDGTDPSPGDVAAGGGPPRSALELGPCWALRRRGAAGSGTWTMCAYPRPPGGKRNAVTCRDEWLGRGGEGRRRQVRGSPCCRQS
jgi:hypothetical protein